MRDSDGKTILHHAISPKVCTHECLLLCQSSRLRSQAKEANAEACQRQLQFLISERKADVAKQDSKFQQTALHVLANVSPSGPRVLHDAHDWGRSPWMVSSSE